MYVSLEYPKTTNLSLTDLGISIKRGSPATKAFHLRDVRARSTDSFLDSGIVEFIICDGVGHYIENQEVVLFWNDGYTVTETNRRGLARLELFRYINPTNWCGILDDGNDEVIGLGLLHNQSVKYRLFYLKIREV
jgi:hypothetical protein